MDSTLLKQYGEYQDQQFYGDLKHTVNGCLASRYLFGYSFESVEERVVICAKMLAEAYMMDVRMDFELEIGEKHGD